jgi:hypothetical protein
VNLATVLMARGAYDAALHQWGMAAMIDRRDPSLPHPIGLRRQIAMQRAALLWARDPQEPTAAGYLIDIGCLERGDHEWACPPN